MLLTNTTSFRHILYLSLAPSALHDPKMFYFSDTCSIQLEDFVIVTGGYGMNKQVSKYDVGGWIEDLTEINFGRQSHGCGHYTNSNNELVKFSSETKIIHY